MVDYEKIGMRITEQRKYLRKISQEKFAEDLGMYQADVSNLEHAKKGSGITDLTKLDLIADYFNIPLESLIFGMEIDQMETYQGKKMVINELPPNTKVKKVHAETLKSLVGEDLNKCFVVTYECGPYTTYVFLEKQYQLGDDMSMENGMPTNPSFILNKPHYYVFYNADVIACCNSAVVRIMDLIYQPSFDKLRQAIPFNVLDVTDPWRTVNPFLPLAEYSVDENEKKTYQLKVLERMEELKKFADEPLVLIESVYVKEDCRKKGIFRMILDVMSLQYGGNYTAWLNMEPTSGYELEQEYSYYPNYTQAIVGQLSENAAVAEKLGFTIDPDPWQREIEKTDEKGRITTESVKVRKCAYKLSKNIANIIKDDGDLVQIGRSKQFVKECENDGASYDITIRSGGYQPKGNLSVVVQVELVIRTISGPNRGSVLYIYGEYYRQKERFCASRSSILDTYIPRKRMFTSKAMFEDYTSFEATQKSEHKDHFLFVDQNLQMLQAEIEKKPGKVRNYAEFIQNIENEL